MTHGRVLVVDDDRNVCEWLEIVLGGVGHRVASLADPARVFEAIRDFQPQVLVLDVLLPGTNGFEIGAVARSADPTLSVIFITGAGSIQDAVRAVRAGAETYLTKPLYQDEITEATSRALERNAERCAARNPNLDATGSRGTLDGLIGRSESMRSLRAQIPLVAATSSNVLIRGETGSGKELVAEAIHAESPRATRPFVRVHCGARSAQAIERELFGYEAGAFAGADERKPGRLEEANEGTLLLDDVSELPPEVQAKLLRVLVDGAFERVGGAERLTVDVRFLATTSRDLRAAAAAGTFDEALFHRLCVIDLELPPLRARRADIPILIDHILAGLASRHGVGHPVVTSDARKLLLRHDWPGNVRELKNVLERAITLSRRGPITVAELSTPRQATSTPKVGPQIPGATFAELERHAILVTYEACGHNVTRTAEILGLSPRTIHYRLREYEGRKGRRNTRGIARIASEPLAADEMQEPDEPDVR